MQGRKANLVLVDEGQKGPGLIEHLRGQGQQVLKYIVGRCRYKVIVAQGSQAFGLVGGK